MLHKNKSQCKIPILPEEDWYGQPKYSTPSKNILRCVGFCLIFFYDNQRKIEVSVKNKPLTISTGTSRLI